MTFPRVDVPVGGMTLAEYLAMLTPDQRAQREQLLATQPSRSSEPRAEEEPILADLRAIGVEVYSVWSQFLDPVETPQIYEVLLRHMRLGNYDERTLGGMARKFGRPTASRYWWDLHELYLTAEGEWYLDGLAAALGASGKREHLDALLDLLGRKDRGPSRILLMRRIKRIGRERGLAAIEALQDDPDLGVQARELLKPKRPRPSQRD